MVTFVGADSGGGNVANINTATDKVTWPAGIQNNDIAFVFWICQNTSTPTTTGWTVPTGGSFDSSSGAARYRLMWRVCDGTETGDLSLTNGTATVNRQSATLVVYRGLDTTNPIDVLATPRDETVSGTTHANPSVTTAVTDAPVATAIGERASTGTNAWTPPSTYTERADSDGAATGSGGTIVAWADDGLGVSRASGTTVTPGVWASGNSFPTANVVTWTLSLKPIAVTAKSLADSASGSDNLTTTAAASLADAGSGADTVAINRPLGVADTGAASDTVATTAAVPLPDTGSSTDTLRANGAIPPADAGAGADNVAVTAGVPLADGGSAAEGISIIVTTSVTDAGAGADAVTATAAVPVTDSGTAGETLAANATAPLTDAGTGADSLGLGIPAPVTDAGHATDGLTTTAAVALTDTGTATESLSIQVTAALTDTAAAADGLSADLSTNPELADGGTATDSLAVAVAVAVQDAGAAVDELGGAPPLETLPDLTGSVGVIGRRTGTATPASRLHGDATPTGRLSATT